MAIKPPTSRKASRLNRNYKFLITNADGSTVKIVLATYSLLVSVLVGMKTRNESFTFTVSIFGNEMDTTDYAQLQSAVSSWLDVYASKAAMAVLDEARGVGIMPSISAAEAGAMMF